MRNSNGFQTTIINIRTYLWLKIHFGDTISALQSLNETISIVYWNKNKYSVVRRIGLTFEMTESGNHPLSFKSEKISSLFIIVLPRRCIHNIELKIHKLHLDTLLFFTFAAFVLCENTNTRTIPQPLIK